MSDPHHPDKAYQALRQVSGYFTLLLLVLLAAVAGALTLVAMLVPPYDPHPALPLIGAATGLVLAGILARVWWAARQLRRHGGAWVAQWAHGRLIDEPTGPIEGRLILITQGLAQYLNLPRPEVYVLEREDSINAFMAGWSARDAALAVTRGALDALTASELQALVAHEFGHMPTDDMRLNMVLLPRVLGFSWVYGWGRGLMQPKSGGTRPHLLRWAVGSVLLTLGWPGWVAAKFLQAVACDRHEYQADASAVRATLDRRGLGNTLRKIWYQNEYTDVRLRHPQADALATMLFHNPQAWRVLNTHPELQDRIRRVLGRDRAPLPAKPTERPLPTAQPAPQPAPLATRQAAPQPVAPRVVAQTPPSTDFERTVATVMSPTPSPVRRPPTPPAAAPVVAPAGAVAATGTSAAAAAVAVAPPVPAAPAEPPLPATPLAAVALAPVPAPPPRPAPPPPVVVLAPPTTVTLTPITSPARAVSSTRMPASPLPPPASPSTSSSASLSASQPTGLSTGDAPSTLPAMGADEAEALRRLLHLDSDAARRAAILAFLRQPGGLGKANAWGLETQGLPSAEAIWMDVQDLGHASRLPVFETLLGRCATTATAERRLLLEAARRLMAAEGRVWHLDVLRYLAMAQSLNARRGAPVAGPGQDEVEPVLGALEHQEWLNVAAFSALLAHLVPAATATGEVSAPGEDWYYAVMVRAAGEQPSSALLPPDVHDPALSPWGLQNLTSDQGASELTHATVALLGVRALDAGTRAALLQIWSDEALARSHAWQLGDDSADALRLTAWLIDAPLPAAVAARYRG